MSDPNFPPDHRNAPLELWRCVRDFICECFGLFGEPQELADRHTLLFKDYKLTLTWLRAGEGLIRRFLLLEAALLPAEPPSHGPPASPPASASKQTPKPAETDFDPTSPATWRVSFRAAAADRRLPGGIGFSKPHQPAQTQPPHAGWKPALRYGEFAAPKFRSAIPLARRFEAILRVYNNPMPFVRRLAARIRKAASFIKRMLNDAWKTSRGIVEQTLHDELGPRVDASVRALTDSS